jgi:hypothetical protein
MEHLGFMVHEGMSPEVIDRMEMEDVAGWLEVMGAYQKAVEENTAKNAPKARR